MTHRPDAPQRRNDQDWFVNPYAFVRLPETPPDRSKPTTHAYYDADRVSGVLEIRITTRTPLFTKGPGDAVTDDGAQATLEALRLRGSYAISGSSLKGVVRSFAETYTGSCLRIIDLPGTLTHRPAPTRGTILKFPYFVKKMNDGKLGLWPAAGYPLPVARSDLTGRTDGEKCRFTTWERRHDTAAQLATSMRAGTKSGILKLTDVGTAADGTTNRRNQTVITSIRGRPGRPPTFDKIVENYNVALQASITADEREFGSDANPEILCGRNLEIDGERKKWGSRGLRHELREGDIVWADSNSPENVTVIGPVQIARRVYPHTVSDALPTGFSPCSKPEEACWCCRVFGMAPEDEDETTPGVSGHVRIGWATANDRADTMTLDLPRMESPKPSYGPFYLASEGGSARTWEQDDPRINGRKFYWHWSDAPAKSDDDPLTVEAVPGGTVFEAEVRFDNLSEADLGLLLASLDPRLLGEGWEDAGLKIGMGKPVGLGSVNIEVVDAYVYDRRARYRSLGTGTVSHLSDIGCYVEAFRSAAAQHFGSDDSGHIEDLRILVTHMPNGQITWPRGKGDSSNGFEWFEENRNPAVPLPLPDETGEGTKRLKPLG